MSFTLYMQRQAACRQFCRDGEWFGKVEPQVRKFCHSKASTSTPLCALHSSAVRLVGSLGDDTLIDQILG